MRSATRHMCELRASWLSKRHLNYLWINQIFNKLSWNDKKNGRRVYTCTYVVYIFEILVGYQPSSHRAISNLSNTNEVWNFNNRATSIRVVHTRWMWIDNLFTMPQMITKLRICIYSSAIQGVFVRHSFYNKYRKTTTASNSFNLQTNTCNQTLKWKWEFGRSNRRSQKYRYTHRSTFSC